MELTERTDYRDDPIWIARQLNIPTANIKTALEKLKSADLWSTDDQSCWRKTMNATVRNDPKFVARLESFLTDPNTVIGILLKTTL